MKKLFSLVDSKVHPDRLVEATKGEVRKYLKRERKKKLPEGVDFWDFDCRCGVSEAQAEVVHVAALIEAIDRVAAAKAQSCYIEIIAKPGVRRPRPQKDSDDSEDEAVQSSR